MKLSFTIHVTQYFIVNLPYKVIFIRIIQETRVNFVCLSVVLEPNNFPFFIKDLSPLKEHLRHLFVIIISILQQKSWEKTLYYSTFVNFRNVDCYFNFPPYIILYPSP